VELHDRLQSALGTTYTLERELGGGGMSRVFVAEEARLGRKVVVKILPPELAADISIERFEREIKLAASLQQANIVPVLSAGDTDGLPYYTMPFVEGEGLRARLQNRGAMSISEAVSVLRDVARALAYAHERGIVHRDIKPDNVLLSGGAAVVTDFGIAKAISASRTHSDSATLTQLGTAIGTPAYISPEQAAGDPDIDHRADIYSFGCMAYEMLTGQPPFANRAPQRLMAAHISEKPRLILELRSDTPPALAAMVMHCLEKDASRRPQTATELFAALDATTTSDAAHAAVPEILLGGRGMLKKALVLYAGAFVAVSVLAKAAIVVIGLPDWVFPGALIVMALGLPATLFTGYTQYVMRRVMTGTVTLTPGGSSSMTTHRTMTNIAIKASPHVSWRRTALYGAYAVGAFVILVGGFMLLRALGIGPFGSLLAAGTLSANDPLLVTEFRVVRGDSTLGGTISQAVRSSLEQSSAIRVVQQSTVADALQRMLKPSTAPLDLPLAREVATREGIKVIVDGEVDGIGTGYLFTLRLMSADSGRELASFHEVADDPKQLIGVADGLTRKLRGKIGESLRAVRASPPLAQATTASLEALRKYTEATKATGAGDFVAAVRLSREAIAIDSGFALAYRHLSESIINARLSRTAADSAITHAKRLSDRLTERERLAVIGDYYSIFATLGEGYLASGPGRDRAKAIAAFERQLELGEYANTNSLGIQLATRRSYARAESLAYARIKVQPGYATTYGNLVGWQIAQGKLNAAESSLAVFGQRFPNDPRILTSRAQLAFARDSFTAAGSMFARVPPGGRRRVAVGALLQLAEMQGRMREQHQWLHERATLDSSPVSTPAQIADTLSAVHDDVWLFGTSAAHVRRIDDAVASPAFSARAVEDRPYLAVATAYAFAGQPDHARAMLARYTAEVKDTTRLRFEQPDFHNALAEIALAEHRVEDAIAEFRQGDLFPDGPATACAACLPANLARAFDAVDARDSTMVMIERALAVPGIGRLYIAVMIGPFEKRLGELYEAKGDRAKAATHYVKFVELWKNADPELQPKVAEVRTRLARLSDTEAKP
jgi:tRNA A-37 threonylcarbamoyl transferase component Bud32/tetratricopeptide (TPR) repeat protein